MELSTADFVVISVLVGAGCAVCSAGLWVMLRQAALASQREMQSRLDELAGALRALESKVAEVSKAPEPKPVAVTEAKAEAPVVAAPVEAQDDDEEVTPETLVVIAAAVTAFLGKKARIRSAKKVASTRAIVSAWSQHGRMLVHTSHNPRLRA